MALTALYVSLTIAFSDDPDTWTDPLTTGAGRRMLFSLAASGSGTLVAVLSAIGITGEFRHRSATAIFGLVGVGLGALLRDQVAAVVGLLIYLFVVEPILTRIPALESWTIYLPGAAKNALTQVSLRSQEYLEPWFGGALFVAYGLAFAVAGMYLAIRRDVT